MVVVRPRLRRRHHRHLALLAVAALVLMACTDEADGSPVPDRHDEVNRSPEQDRLDAARSRWEASGIEDYEWTYDRICFLP